MNKPYATLLISVTVYELQAKLGAKKQMIFNPKLTICVCCVALLKEKKRLKGFEFNIKICDVYTHTLNYYVFTNTQNQIHPCKSI